MNPGTHGGSTRPLRIVRIATSPFFVLHHLEGQIGALVAAGHEVTIVTSPIEGFERIAALGVARVVALDIPREISPLADLRALLSWSSRSIAVIATHSTPSCMATGRQIQPGEMT